MEGRARSVQIGRLVAVWSVKYSPSWGGLPCIRRRRTYFGEQGFGGRHEIKARHFCASGLPPDEKAKLCPVSAGPGDLDPQPARPLGKGNPAAQFEILQPDNP